MKRVSLRVAAGKSDVRVLRERGVAWWDAVGPSVQLDVRERVSLLHVLVNCVENLKNSAVVAP